MRCGGTFCTLSFIFGGSFLGVLGAFRRKANRSGAKERTATSLWRSTGTAEGEGSSKPLSHPQVEPPKEEPYKGGDLCGCTILYGLFVS